MSWRLVPTCANGRPAFATYADGRLAALIVMAVRDGWITELTSFCDARMYERFDLHAPLPG
ncbi:hypothetical protein AB0L06_26075 [Spirillospora sp. NPDC052269]